MILLEELHHLHQREALMDGFELAGCNSDLSEPFLAFLANKCKLS